MNGNTQRIAFPVESSASFGVAVTVELGVLEIVVVVVVMEDVEVEVEITVVGAVVELGVAVESDAIGAPVTDVRVPVSVAVVASAMFGIGIPFAAAAEAITEGSRIEPTFKVNELTMDDSTSVDISEGTTREVIVTPGIVTPCGSVNVACAAAPVLITSKETN